MLVHLIKGLMIGISIAVPIGPVSILCVRQTLLGGQRSGIISGLGAATAHAGYGLLTLCGLSLLSHYVIQHQFWFHLLSGLYLCILGLRLVQKRHLQPSGTNLRTKVDNLYLSTLIIAGTNPMTLVTFITLTGAYSADFSISPIAKLAIIIGIFISSTLWWMLLCRIIHTLRHRINPTSLLWLYRLSGATIALLGLILLAS